MIIGVAELTLYLPWANSLKQKRQEARSLIERVRFKFNVAIAEVGRQDEHRYLNLGITCVSNASHHANSILGSVISFIEAHSEAEIIASRLELF